MSRPFFAMGAYKSRVSSAASASFGAVGAAYHATAFSFAGAQVMAAGGIARHNSSVAYTSSGSIGLVGDSVLGSGDWDVTPAPTFTEGVQTPYDVAATGPVDLGYTAGGIWGVDPDAASLPTGMALTDAGSLTVGSATATSASGVVFSYHEPGALPTLTLHSTSAGTFPYMATVYPAEGAVPSGQILISPDDSTFRSTVLSTWPDGSAQVMVGAGHKAVSASSTTEVKLRPGDPSGTALTTAVLALIVTNVSVNFGTALSFTNFTSGYDRIWWANSQVICARYRLPITNKGSMEAVIDVHAFANGRAFVEVVVENGKTNCDAATVTSTTTQTYTSATVSVNGSTIATVSSPTASMAAPTRRLSATYSGGHEPFRAWYCSGWVGGDPLLEVTHDADSMMAHPWFWKRAVVSTETYATEYQQTYDTYQPWSTCRLRVPGMDAGGDDEQIALHTKEQAAYFISGDKYARRAVLATGTALLSLGMNWRHTDGNVPTRAQTTNKSTSGGTWPELTTEPRYGGSSTADGSHIPSVALIPFLCRPSPMFIELAQKELAWNQVDYSVNASGGHISDQVRSRGWRMRNAAIATYLTPDSDSTRKDAYRAVITGESLKVKEMLDASFNTLGALWYPSVNSSFTNADPNVSGDNSSSRAGYQGSFFMHNFVALSYDAVSKAKVLQGSAATNFDAIADDLFGFVIRWITDATGYEWRGLPYQPTIGVVVDASTLNMSPHNLVTLTKNEMSGTVPTSAGSWLTLLPDDYNYDTDLDDDPSASSFAYNYSSIFFATLAAGVERGVTNADAAWTAVYGTSGNGGITNFSTWLSGYSTYPQWNRWPRNH